MSWRGWLAFAGIGAALALAWRGDWVAAGEAAAAVLVPVLWWVRGEFAATRTRFRVSAGMSAALAEAHPSHPARRGMRYPAQT